MRKSTLLSVLIATTIIAAADMAYAAVPPVDRFGRPALTVCPTSTIDKIYHFDKVIFQLGTGQLAPIAAADFNTLNALPRNTDLDIKIIDIPTAVADLESKVLSFWERSQLTSTTGNCFELGSSNTRRSSAIRKGSTPLSTTSSCCGGGLSVAYRPFRYRVSFTCARR